MRARHENISLRRLVPEILDRLAADDPQAVHSRSEVSVAKDDLNN